MAKQAVGCRNMVRVKVWHTHITVWLLKKIQSTYFNVLYAYFITGPTYGRTLSSSMRIQFVSCLLRA